MIYITPFKTQTLETTGPSNDSGFASLDDVVAVMGPDHVKRTRALLVYGDETDRVLFSRAPFRIDGVEVPTIDDPVNNA